MEILDVDQLKTNIWYSAQPHWDDVEDYILFDQTGKTIKWWSVQKWGDPSQQYILNYDATRETFYDDVFEVHTFKEHPLSTEEKREFIQVAFEGRT